MPPPKTGDRPFRPPPRVVLPRSSSPNSPKMAVLPPQKPRRHYLPLSLSEWDLRARKERKGGGEERHSARRNSTTGIVGTSLDRPIVPTSNTPPLEAPSVPELPEYPPPLPSRSLFTKMGQLFRHNSRATVASELEDDDVRSVGSLDTGIAKKDRQHRRESGTRSDIFAGMTKSRPSGLGLLSLSTLFLGAKSRSPFGRRRYRVQKVAAEAAQGETRGQMPPLGEHCIWLRSRGLADEASAEVAEEEAEASGRSRWFEA